MRAHVLIPTASRSSFKQPQTRILQPAKQMCADLQSGLASAGMCVPACLPWRLFLSGNLYGRSVCVFRGEKPAGLMKSNLTTPFRQDIPQHFAVQHRNAVGGWGAEGGAEWSADCPQRLWDMEGVFKVKAPLLCIILFNEGRGNGGSCQTIEQERPHTLFLSLSSGEWVGERG